MKYLLTILCLAVGFSANAQKYTRLYKKIASGCTNLLDNPEEFVTLDVFPGSSVSLVKSSFSPKKVYLSDLSDRGQQRLIEAFDTKSKNATDLYKNISKPFIEPGPPVPKNKDYSQLLVHLEFNINDSHNLSSANKGRISEQRITVLLAPGSEVEFDAFSGLNTSYEVVDFGDVSVSRTRNFSLNAGLEIAGTGSTSTTTTGTNDSSNNAVTSSNKSNLGVGLSNSRTITELANQRTRVISQMGTMTPSGFEYLQQGTPANPLEGKVSLDLIVKVKNFEKHTIDAFTFANLFTGGNIQTNQKDISINQYLLTMPRLTKDVSISVQQQFEYRQILNRKGQRTKAEYDDVICVTESGVVSETSHALIKPTQLLKFRKYYFLTDGPNKVYINYQGVDREIKMESLSQAQELAGYLKVSRSKKIGGFDLKWGDISGSLSKLTEDAIDAMYVRVFN